MVTFYCSVIVVPNRIVSRKPIKALNMYHAFILVSDFYKRLHRFDVIYLVEFNNHFKYYDKHGKVLLYI